jgi:hypothetical protein
MDKFNKGDRVEYFAGGINHIPSCVGKTGTVTGSDEYSTKGSWDDGMFFNVDTKNLRLIGDGLVVGKEYHLLPDPKIGGEVGVLFAGVFFEADVTRVKLIALADIRGNVLAEAVDGEGGKLKVRQQVHKSFLAPLEDGIVIGEEYELLPKPKWRRVTEEEAEGAVFFSSDVTRVRVESKSILTGEQGNYNVKALNGSSKNYTQAVHKSFLRPVSDAVVDDNQKINDFWKVGAVIEFTVDGKMDSCGGNFTVGCRRVIMPDVWDKVVSVARGDVFTTITFRVKLEKLGAGVVGFRHGSGPLADVHLAILDLFKYIKDVKLITPAPEPEKKYTVELTESEVLRLRDKLSNVGITGDYKLYARFADLLND